jgi:hypothetical protein
MKKLVIFLLTFLITISCKKEKVSIEIIDDPLLLAGLYSISMDTLNLGTSQYILNTYLNRDFFPGVPTPKNPIHPLTASIILLNCDSLPVADNLKIDKLYVIYNQLIWISFPVDNKQHYYPYQLHRVSVNGPEWGPDNNADVILKIIDDSNQKEYYLIAKNQEIFITN